MNSIKLGRSFANVLSCRCMHGYPTGTQKVLPPARIRRLQEKFQMDNGIPLYLKGGVVDRFLFGLTLMLAVTGLGFSVKTIYTLSLPKTPN